MSVYHHGPLAIHLAAGNCQFNVLFCPFIFACFCSLFICQSICILSI